MSESSFRSDARCAIANSLQYAPQKEKLSLKLKIGDHDEIVEEGEVFSEATFITIE